MSQGVYTLDEAELAFARTLNGRVWELLEKTDRSKSEAEEMVHAAHASCYHWLQSGSEVNGLFPEFTRCWRFKNPRYATRLQGLSIIDERT